MEPQHALTSRATQKPRRGGGAQAIERALAVLDLFRDARSDLGIMHIASSLKLSPSTAHRIVAALVRGGYLVQNKKSEQYYAGRNAMLLGLAAERNLGLHAALPLLERLGATTQESVNLGVREGMSGLVLLRVLSPQPLRFDQQPGTKTPLHASAMGKCLLSFSGDIEEYLESFDGRPTKFTPSTITAPRALRKELEAICDRGYSIDNEESIPGLRCVGAPVKDAHGRVRAALAIQAPTVRMPDKRVADLAADIMNTAKELADLLPVDRVL